MNLNVRGDRYKWSRESIVPNGTVGETAFPGESPRVEKWTLRARDQARRYCPRVCAGGWPGRRSPGRWPKELQAKGQPAVKLHCLPYQPHQAISPQIPGGTVWGANKESWLQSPWNQTASETAGTQGLGTQGGHWLWGLVETLGGLPTEEE